MRLTLEILDAVETEKIKNTFATLGLGIVGEETVGCTMLVNEVFESAAHTYHIQEGTWGRQQS
jgi:hypothetical protein